MESWRSDGGRFRGLGRNAIIVETIENKTCNCKDSNSIKDDGQMETPQEMNEQ